ncbi:hypothetical protein [Salinigranum halophilum]|uniref:hypothetical protein n=1 Tax=Salinigranum halophilum TaxID=2565931 RepID=UPI0010A78E05|nr:hypothetical protein [Salinigranum halophilum]
MPDISVTDDQRERLRRVQERLAADVVYGHVRPRDAIEFLLDSVEEATAAGADGAASTPTPETAAADTNANANANASAEFEVRNGRPAASHRAATDEDAAAGDAPENEADARAADGAEGPDGPDGGAGNAGAAGDDARLNSVMSLLDDHDEVWREADGGEAKYEVDLPDGGTERARTKDDVRAVLFEYYR